MAEVSKIITEKQTDPWDGERPGQDAKKKPEKTIITYRRISKRLAVDTTSQVYCSCSIIYFNQSLMLITAQK